MNLNRQERSHCWRGIDLALSSPDIDSLIPHVIPSAEPGVSPAYSPVGPRTQNEATTLECPSGNCNAGLLPRGLSQTKGKAVLAVLGCDPALFSGGGCLVDPLCLVLIHDKDPCQGSCQRRTLRRSINLELALLSLKVAILGSSRLSLLMSWNRLLMSSGYCCSCPGSRGSFYSPLLLLSVSR